MAILQTALAYHAHCVLLASMFPLPVTRRPTRHAAHVRPDQWISARMIQDATLCAWLAMCGYKRSAWNALCRTRNASLARNEQHYARLKTEDVSRAHRLRQVIGAGLAALRRVSGTVGMVIGNPVALALSTRQRQLMYAMGVCSHLW